MPLANEVAQEIRINSKLGWIMVTDDGRRKDSDDLHRRIQLVKTSMTAEVVKACIQ